MPSLKKHANIVRFPSLISVDRSDEAYAILQKYHSEGDNGDEFVRLEFAQIQSTIAQEQETAKAFVWADVLRYKHDPSRMTRSPNTDFASKRPSDETKIPSR